MNKFQILIFGASSTHGNWDELGGWVNRMRLALIKKIIDSPDRYHGHIFNLGVPGNTTSDLIERMDNEIKARLFYPKTIIVLSGGTNDSRLMTADKTPIVTNKQFQANWEELFRIAKKHTDNVVATGLTPVDEKRTDPWDETYSYVNDRIAAFSKVIAKCSREQGIPFVDVFSAFYSEDYNGLLSDGLHPNTRGQKKLFELIYPAVSRLL